MSNANGGNGDEGDGNGNNAGTGIVTKTRPKTKKPSLYKVLLLNDDYTPMEFVVHILEHIFGKNREECRGLRGDRERQEPGHRDIHLRGRRDESGAGH